ncbi:GntR family transcriptional regulator [Effusibacillus pohliae]|uniref:GntR family transcriptional regulator n=1 Tax=Effusibacillus pohliae TaxID=232270 RepID=UPI00039ADF21|nr:GntR family transcriptional regulator [Effusibacillus pohliae]
MEQVRQSLPEQNQERIAAQMFEGKLEPGTRLKEESLADEFGTSRAPIRETLYILKSRCRCPTMEKTLYINSRRDGESSQNERFQPP